MPSTVTPWPAESNDAYPRLLHIYSEGLTNRHLRIVDSDKQTALYEVYMPRNIFSSKPHMTITTAAGPGLPAIPIGTATFHSFSRRTDLTMFSSSVSTSSTSSSSSHQQQYHQQQQREESSTVVLEPHGLFSRGLHFSSKVAGPLVWNRESVFRGQMVLQQDNNNHHHHHHNSNNNTGSGGGEAIARFEPTAFATRKVGKVELWSARVQGVLLDEVVVSVMAIVELERRRRANNSGAGAGVGGR